MGDSTFKEIKNCFNHAFLNGTFPDSLKQTNVVSVQKQENATDESSFCPTITF